MAALRALEAAARLRSYSRAADELHVTHGAVSHQIRGLETEFGLRLFQREGNEMSPLPAARRLAGTVAEALKVLEGGVARTRAEGAPNSLVVTTLATFARQLVTPRLHRFLEANTGLEIEIRADDDLADFVTDGVDVALRWGLGQWPGLVVEPLSMDSFYPVCSPAFLERHPMATLEDLIRAPRLRQRHLPWSMWFSVMGVEVEDAPGGLVFNHSGVQLDAAIDGLGIALARHGLARRELIDGRLVRPFPDAVAAEQGYFVVYRADSPKRPLIERFRDWVKAEIDAPVEDGALVNPAECLPSPAER
jgi:LysR family glycine cleavage system transcriptional activator